MKTIPNNPSICWHCDRMVDALTPTGDKPDITPDPGSVTLCLYCGAVAIVGEEMTLERPTKEDLDEIIKNDEFRMTYANFSWARQYVMIKGSLMRNRENPDR